MDTTQFPVAVKRRPPSKHSWVSRRAEYVVDSEANRFRYCIDVFGWTADNPGHGPNGERRIVCRVGNGIGLFEELADRPRDDNSVIRLH